MAKVSIRFAAAAVRALEEILAWYRGEAVPEIGRRLVSEVMARIEALPDHPDMGRTVPEFNQPELRELIQPPFRIVYKPEPARVRIVRVWCSEGLLRLG